MHRSITHTPPHTHQHTHTGTATHRAHLQRLALTHTDTGTRTHSRARTAHAHTCSRPLCHRWPPAPTPTPRAASAARPRRGSSSLCPLVGSKIPSACQIGWSIFVFCAGEAGAFPPLPPPPSPLLPTAHALQEPCEPPLPAQRSAPPCIARPPRAGCRDPGRPPPREGRASGGSDEGRRRGRERLQKASAARAAGVGAAGLTSRGCGAGLNTARTSAPTST